MHGTDSVIGYNVIQNLVKFFANYVKRKVLKTYIVMLDLLISKFSPSKIIRILKNIKD
jgi:hypothetical protein